MVAVWHAHTHSLTHDHRRQAARASRLRVRRATIVASVTRSSTRGDVSDELLLPDCTRTLAHVRLQFRGGRHGEFERAFALVCLIHTQSTYTRPIFGTVQACRRHRLGIWSDLRVPSFDQFFAGSRSNQGSCPANEQRQHVSTSRSSPRAAEALREQVVVARVEPALHLQRVSDPPPWPLRNSMPAHRCVRRESNPLGNLQQALDLPPGRWGIARCYDRVIRTVSNGTRSPQRCEYRTTG